METDFRTAIKESILKKKLCDRFPDFLGGVENLRIGYSESAYKKRISVYLVVREELDYVVRFENSGLTVDPGKLYKLFEYQIWRSWQKMKDLPDKIKRKFGDFIISTGLFEMDNLVCRNGKKYTWPMPGHEDEFYWILLEDWIAWKDQERANRPDIKRKTGSQVNPWIRGDAKRPSFVDDEEMADRWELAFGKKKN